MLSKSQLLEGICNYSGISRLRWQNLPNGLYCFNYHRIGDPAASRFDPNLFSCNQEVFEQQLQFYKKEFVVINLEKCIDLLNEGGGLKKRYALITFDDGYKDNYELAFASLKRHGLTALFFIPTDYIGSNIIPWWDQIAYLIKTSQASEVKLDWWDNPIPIERGNVVLTIRAVLNKIKQQDGESMDTKLNQLEINLGSKPFDAAKESLFTSWPMLHEMIQSDMDIGSHTCSHQILSHLSHDEQYNEMLKSRQVLESTLGKEIKALAYPVGGTDSFDEQSMRLAQKAGYDIAFSFIPGINRDPQEHRYRLFRLGIEENASPVRLKYMIGRV